MNHKSFTRIEMLEKKEISEDIREEGEIASVGSGQSKIISKRIPALFIH